MFLTPVKFSEAVTINREVILSLLAASGPAEFSQIVYECQQQGFGTLNTTDAALQSLLDSGEVVKELIQPEIEGDDQYYVYDLA